MNLIWIGIILLALVASAVAVVVAEIVIYLVTRKRHRALRYTLMCLPLIGIYLLWNGWLGPSELRDPHELAARFELVFRFPPPSSVTDMRYQLQDGPDAMTEWFKFQIDADALNRLAPKLETVTAAQFREKGGSNSPDWWLPANASSTVTYQHGAMFIPPGTSPSSRELWIAYDSVSHTAFCYIDSML